MTGRSLEEAVVLCVMLEEAARIQLLVDATGPDVPDFPPEDVARLRDNLLRREQFVIDFVYLARKANASGDKARLAGKGRWKIKRSRPRSDCRSAPMSFRSSA